MVSTSKLRGTWKGGGFVGNDANVVIALYANTPKVRDSFGYKESYEAYRGQQRACFTILKEWVRIHIRERPEMHRLADSMTEVDGRGYMFELRRVEWGNEVNPFYLLLARTLKEMAEAFNLHPHSNCSTPYALEYSWVKGNGLEYDTVRLGAYAYAVGVKVEVEVANDFFTAEEL
jgi:hypothetical protein